MNQLSGKDGDLLRAAYSGILFRTAFKSRLREIGTQWALAYVKTPPPYGNLRVPLVKSKLKMLQGMNDRTPFAPKTPRRPRLEANFLGN